MALISVLAIVNASFIHLTLFIFSLIIPFSEYTNLSLWKLSLITGFIALLFVCLLYSFLLEYKKIPILPFLIFIILLGFLIGNLFFDGSIVTEQGEALSSENLNLDFSQINYSFSFITSIIVVVFQTYVILFMLIMSLKIQKTARNKDLITGLIINTFMFLIPISFYMLYAFLTVPIYRDLYFMSLMLIQILVWITLIKRPEMFLLLTNKIYYINIYHKSGVQLYSYKFEKISNATESQIWGNILIGLNHILSEFVDKSDQIDMLQTKNTEIVVNYDDLGFAVMVITNHKNDILQKMMDNFTQEFKQRYQNDLMEISDLNRLIDVADFEETKQIIENNFPLFV